MANNPPPGMTREEWVHRDEFEECPGCSECADPNCPACKGAGRVSTGLTSWMCGCTYEEIGSEAYTKRVAHDVDALKYSPRQILADCGATPYVLKAWEAGYCQSQMYCLAPRGRCETGPS